MSMTRYERAESAAKMLIDALRAIYTPDTGVTLPPVNSTRGVAEIESDGNTEHIYISFGYAGSSNRAYVTLKAGTYHARESRFEVGTDGVKIAGFLASFERLVKQARTRNANYAAAQARVKVQEDTAAANEAVLRALAAANGWTVTQDLNDEPMVTLANGLTLTPSNAHAGRIRVRLGAAYSAPTIAHSTPAAVATFVPAFINFANQ